MNPSKSSVSALQEYCSKKHEPLPLYDIVVVEGPEPKTFECTIEAFNMEAMAIGRSKRDAKHMAAAALIKKMRPIYRSIDAINEDLEEGNLVPPHDTVKSLRDYCVSTNSPLPEFSIVESKGTPDSPQFTIKCQVSTIVRFGTADTKKDARQKAAWEMLLAIGPQRDQVIESNAHLVSLDAHIDDVIEERYEKFRTYNQLIEDKGKKDEIGVKLTERHNFFAKFRSDLKNEAFAVIRSNEYESVKDKAMAIFEALKIIPTFSTLPTITAQPLTCIEMNVEYNAGFVGTEPLIYQDVIDYFATMLIYAPDPKRPNFDNIKAIV